jgi:uncharacterized protein YjbI with pentapeptide repeats
MGVVVLAAWAWASTRADAAAVAAPCPASPASLNATDKILLNCNFSGWNLSNADFSGSTLQNAAFVGANLTGAKFNGTTLQSHVGSATQVTDFSFANLSRASFVGAIFSGPVYLTHATLTCADFSGIQGDAIFGDSLVLDNSQGCRTKFQKTTMRCEFFSQWNLLDLTEADISACRARLATPSGQTIGHDFSGGVYTRVVFDGLDLTGSKWDNTALAGASFQKAILDGATGFAANDLTQAVFTYARLKQVNLSTAKLYGAVLDNANLEGANLSGAFLSPCTPPATCVAASLRGAYLKNVDLSGSHLQSATFSNASFYSSTPAGSGSCDTSKKDCASAKSATLTNTNFNGAYLFGVDFTGAQMHGVNFDGAVLVAANFSGATVAPEPNQVNGSFVNAFLQGAHLGEAKLDGVTFAGAFVDFNPQGNTLFIELSPAHTKFPGWPTPDEPVCTRVTYGAWASVPTDKPDITCPDGFKHEGGCGPANGQNAHWNNNTNIATNDPRASYREDASFTPKAAEICKRNLAW